MRHHVLLAIQTNPKQAKFYYFSFAVDSLAKFGSPRRNYCNIITTDFNVLHLGSITSKSLLKLHYWWLKNKERKVDFRFVERKFLAAINRTGSAKGALVPVLLRITHSTKSGLPVSLPGLFPPWSNEARKLIAGQ